MNNLLENNGLRIIDSPMARGENNVQNIDLPMNPYYNYYEMRFVCSWIYKSDKKIPVPNQNLHFNYRPTIQYTTRSLIRKLIDFFVCFYNVYVRLMVGRLNQ